MARHQAPQGHFKPIVDIATKMLQSCFEILFIYFLLYLINFAQRNGPLANVSSEARYPFRCQDITSVPLI